ncbi:hypothetical protein GOODEAATRI_012829 [Goodea atripinnis]|uniref:Vigilin n=1 Tax=Goodea atripinnis TaxID=208336 RepID=A0ABV0NU55_9TELE
MRTNFLPTRMPSHRSLRKRLHLRGRRKLPMPGHQRFALSSPPLLPRYTGLLVFHVPLEERKYKDINQFGEGDQAKVCVDIMHKTGAHLELSLAKDQGLSIMVSGKLDAVMKARKEIVSRLQTQASATVAIPKEHHRFVIGKNGEKLQELELKTATKIQIPRPDDLSNQIKISGTKEGLEKAKHEILLISAEQDKRAVERVNIDKVYHPFITGAYNKLVGEMMQETSARINVPPPSVNKTEIVITGEKEQVALAVAMIKKIYEEKKKNTTTIAVEVKKSQHKYVVGPKGNTLQEILDRTGVSVEIPPSDNSSETVILRGEPDRLGQALTEVYAKVSRMDYAEITVDPKFHRHLIGKGGVNINRIKELHKVTVRIPPDNEKSNLIRIEGDPQGVQEAKKELLELASRMVSTDLRLLLTRYTVYYSAMRCSVTLSGLQENERTKDLIIEQRFHRAIIGQKGEKIKEVRDKFPEVENSYSLSVPIFKQFHRNIIGKGGSNIKKVLYVNNRIALLGPLSGGNIRKVRDSTGARIIFPTSEDKDQELITVVGTEEAVRTAQKELEELIKSLDNIVEDTMIVDPKHHRYFVARRGQVLRDLADEYGGVMALVPVTIEVEVPFELHRYIIGQKGSGIRKMMDEFEVNIQVPPPDQQSDKIAITGLASHLERAKEGLLERVKELQAEQEDRALKSFKLTITVDPKYHPKIIGRKGAIITNIRTEHDVNIQFLEKNDENQDQITITGYEQNAIAARDAIQGIVDELEEMISEEITLDSRVHARIIGARGKGIRKIMDEFKASSKCPPV